MVCVVMIHNSGRNKIALRVAWLSLRQTLKTGRFRGLGLPSSQSFFSNLILPVGLPHTHSLPSKVHFEGRNIRFRSGKVVRFPCFRE